MSPPPPPPLSPCYMVVPVADGRYLYHHRTTFSCSSSNPSLVNQEPMVMCISWLGVGRLYLGGDGTGTAAVADFGGAGLLGHAAAGLPCRTAARLEPAGP